MAHRFSRSEKGKWTAAPVLAKRPPLRIPASNNNELIAANKLTLIGRVTNPILQRTRAVVDFFPQIWNLEVLEEAKVRVEVDGFHPLMMDMEIQLPSEEIISVEFEYIKIEKHCFTCFSLLHEEINCPIRDRNAPPLRIGSWVSLNGWLSNALKLIKEDMMIEEATNAQPLKIDSTLLAMRINTTNVNTLIIETFPYLIGMLLH
ncbi:Zinc knuckle CX2CX4HX4C protein [Raphanus sativus]|nr:Zinc knuckle CX2CX4HX4C protein [Raphanus sativus]